MTADTSALIAVPTRAPSPQALRAAIETEPALLPALALVESIVGASGSGFSLGAQANPLLAEWRDGAMDAAAFTPEHAAIAAAACSRYGRGSGQGDTLNLLDPMVYAVARERDEPLLCTGSEFATSDAATIPADQPPLIKLA